MKYDGIVVKMKSKDGLFLFLVDPDTNELQDGINISDHECYKDMNEQQLMVVSVTFKDGTEELEKIDIEEFIYGDSYGKYDTFLYIQDINLYTIGENGENNNINEISLDKVAKDGKLGNIALECIENSKKSNQ